MVWNRKIVLMLMRCFVLATCVSATDTAAADLPAESDRLPLYCVENRGQADPCVRFLLHGTCGSVFFTRNSVVLATKARQTPDEPKEYTSVNFGNHWQTASQGSGVPRAQMHSALDSLSKLDQAFVWPTDNEKELATCIGFVNPNPSLVVEGFERLPIKVNYLIGNNRAQWIRGAATYRGVIYRNVWPGVNVIYQVEGNQWRRRIEVSAGVDIGRIRFRYEGTNSIALRGSGELVVAGPLSFTEPKPEIRQEKAGKTVELSGVYTCDHNIVGYHIEQADRSRPLSISSVSSLISNVFLASSGFKKAPNLTPDAGTTTYVIGNLYSPRFPPSSDLPGAYRDGYNKYIIAKIDSAGQLVYATFLGGSSEDTANALVVEPGGFLYVTGDTYSSDFPITWDAYDKDYNGVQDSFAARLNSFGDDLIYSTFLVKDCDGPFEQVVGELATSGPALRSTQEGRIFSSGQPKLLAVIIDDVTSEEQVQEFLHLGIPITLAILPSATAAAIRQASVSTRACMLLHAPMEPLIPGGTQDMISVKSGNYENQALLDEWLSHMPGVIGISNHEGSKVTADPAVTDSIMRVLAKHGLLFLDSKTTPTTVVRPIADRLGVFCLERDSFLDRDTFEQTVARTLTLAEIAKKRGYAIGICHVSRGSDMALASCIPEILSGGLQFVTIQDLASTITR